MESRQSPAVSCVAAINEMVQDLSESLKKHFSEILGHFRLLLHTAATADIYTQVIQSHITALREDGSAVQRLMDAVRLHMAAIRNPDVAWLDWHIDAIIRYLDGGHRPFTIGRVQFEKRGGVPKGHDACIEPGILGMDS